MLAYTGADIGWWIAFALALLLMGGLMVGAGYRRTRAVARRRSGGGLRAVPVARARHRMA